MRYGVAHGGLGLAVHFDSLVACQATIQHWSHMGMLVRCIMDLAAFGHKHRIIRHTAVYISMPFICPSCAVILYQNDVAKPHAHSTRA